MISITDDGFAFAKLDNKPDFLLQISFNDVFIDELGRRPTDNERKEIEQKYHIFNDDQAREIAEFYHSSVLVGAVGTTMFSKVELI